MVIVQADDGKVLFWILSLLVEKICVCGRDASARGPLHPAADKYDDCGKRIDSSTSAQQAEGQPSVLPNRLMDAQAVKTAFYDSKQLGMQATVNVVLPCCEDKRASRRMSDYW